MKYIDSLRRTRAELDRALAQARANGALRLASELEIGRTAVSSRIQEEARIEVSDKDDGQVAYEAYGEIVEWVTVSGQAMPSWHEQSAKLRDAWQFAAEAVLRVAAEREK